MPPKLSNFNKMNKKITILSIIAGWSPILVLAQTTSSQTQCTGSGTTLCTIINLIVGYLNQVLVLLIGLSVVTFTWYVFKYFVKPNENRDEAGKYVMYSLIGFFVILSMWGLVNILQGTFGLGNSTNMPGSWSNVTSLFPTK
jgi:hypothetical protein